MSIYVFLCCEDCQESLWVKDDNIEKAHVDPTVLGKFIVRHEKCDRLRVLDDFTDVTSGRGDVEHYRRFKG